MAQVIWDSVALDDLEEIARYIERDSPPAARRFVQRIFDRVEKLKRFPFIGGFVEEDRHKRYRQLIQGNYRIIYRASNDVIYVVAIYHAARLLSDDRMP